MQFLAAYQPQTMLKAAAPQLLRELPVLDESEMAVFTSRKLRNSCAHCGLRSAGTAAIGEADPFAVLVKSQVQAGRLEVTLPRPTMAGCGLKRTSNVGVKVATEKFPSFLRRT